jgi:hypothetical protein
MKASFDTEAANVDLNNDVNSTHYVITIPAAITVGGSAVELKATGHIMADKKLDITLTGTNTDTTSHELQLINGTDKVKYQLTVKQTENDSDKGTVLTSTNGTFTVFTVKGAKGKLMSDYTSTEGYIPTYSMTAALKEGEAASVSGEYSDTLTFTAALNNVS